MIDLELSRIPSTLNYMPNTHVEIRGSLNPSLYDEVIPVEPSLSQRSLILTKTANKVPTDSNIALYDIRDSNLATKTYMHNQLMDKAKKIIPVHLDTHPVDNFQKSMSQQNYINFDSEINSDFHGTTTSFDKLTGYQPPVYHPSLNDERMARYTVERHYTHESDRAKTAIALQNSEYIKERNRRQHEADDFFLKRVKKCRIDESKMPYLNDFKVQRTSQGGKVTSKWVDPNEEEWLKHEKKFTNSDRQSLQTLKNPDEKILQDYYQQQMRAIKEREQRIDPGIRDGEVKDKYEGDPITKWFKQLFLSKKGTHTNSTRHNMGINNKVDIKARPKTVADQIEELPPAANITKAPLDKHRMDKVQHYLKQRKFDELDEKVFKYIFNQVDNNQVKQINKNQRPKNINTYMVYDHDNKIRLYQVFEDDVLYSDIPIQVVNKEMRKLLENKESRLFNVEDLPMELVNDLVTKITDTTRIKVRKSDKIMQDEFKQFENNDRVKPVEKERINSHQKQNHPRVKDEIELKQPIQDVQHVQKNETPNRSEPTKEALHATMRARVPNLRKFHT